MINTINIELCAEDRARIDRLAAALEALQPPKTITAAAFPTGDPEADALAAQILLMRDRGKSATETPQEPTEAAEAPAAPITPPKDETPTEEATAATEEATAATEDAEPTVTLAQIQQKVTELVTADKGKKRAQVREIVNAYAKKVSELPEDKLPEVWGKLVALEREVLGA